MEGDSNLGIAASARYSEMLHTGHRAWVSIGIVPTSIVGGRVVLTDNEDPQLAYEVLTGGMFWPQLLRGRTSRLARRGRSVHSGESAWGSSGSKSSSRARG